MYYMMFNKGAKIQSITRLGNAEMVRNLVILVF